MLDAMDLSGTNGEIHAALAAWRKKKFELMRGPFVQQRRNDEQEAEKAPSLVVQKIRDAILDETFEPGERLPEEQLGKMFNVSRSPLREVLLSLEKEGAVVMEPYKGATVKPLSPEEALDIADLRLALITLAAKPAYRHLSSAGLRSCLRARKADDPQQESQGILRMRSAILGHYIREGPTAYSLGGVPATE
jgi:DNA-binding GntR family transcriptional regulator